MKLRLKLVRAALTSPTRITGLDTITLQIVNIFVMHYFSWSYSSRICLDVFEIASFVSTCITIRSNFFSSSVTKWCFRSSAVAPLKFRILTIWLWFDSCFPSIPVSSQCQTNKPVPAGKACLKLPGVFDYTEAIWKCTDTHIFSFAHLFW